jgi:MFS family permease
MHFKDYFDQPSRATIGTVVAVLEIGAFISSLLVGRIGDMIGRRRTILYGSIVFFVGGAFQTFATGIPMMMVGRVIAGLGVGALSTIVPVYQSEISVFTPSFVTLSFRYTDQTTASSQPW